MIQKAIDAFGENMFTEDGELLPDSGKADRRRSKQITGLEGEQFKSQYAESDKLAGQNKLTRERMSGAPSWETKAKEIQMAHDEANSPVHLLNESAIKLKLAFDELAKSVNDKKWSDPG